MKTLKAGALYFALTFAAGFVLGPIRVLWAVPRFGERWAELAEQPIMLVVIVVAARWVMQRMSVPQAASNRIAVGLVALGLLVLAELTVVLQLQGLTFNQYLASRDPVSGTVYVIMLGVFAIMPWAIGRDRRSNDAPERRQQE